MTRTWSLPLVACAVCAAVVVAVPARAADPGPAASATPADDAVLARPTIRAHQFTLEESLALADRNFPNLWAARARLAYTHAQLEEVRWTPWFQWSANALFGVTPPLVGTVIFPDGTTLNSRNITGLGIGTCSTCLQPAVHFDIGGVVPLYTFGKITSSLEAAEANVRVSEWDMEKARQGMRMDVRRAYFGLQFARDVTYIAKDATDRLDKAITGIKERLAKGDQGVNDTDRLSLETYKQEVIAQALQAPKGETYAVAALRFLTGVEVGYDVVDEPLKRPDRPLVAVAQYLEAARILRPDVNMARAGVVARRALVDYNRARLYPDIGLTLGASFTSTPSATQQNNLFASDPFNGFGYVGGLGMRWSLYLLPQAARTQQAEAQLEETRALQRLALGNAGLEVEKAYADAVEAKAREEAWEKAEHITKQWIANVQDHIDLGTWNETSLNFPLRSYLNARVQHLQALMDYNVAMSNLAMVSGWDSAAPQGS
jgi:outer membrane protein TolC